MDKVIKVIEAIPHEKDREVVLRDISEVLHEDISGVLKVKDNRIKRCVLQ